MLDSTKTAYQNLAAARVSGINALINNLTPPRIGEYWHAQGGTYAGVMRDGSRQWHLILASATICERWGYLGMSMFGVFSERDGKHNTDLILSYDPKNRIGAFCKSITAGGNSDFYWPSQFENLLLYANLPDHVEGRTHWSSTQFADSYASAHDFASGFPRNLSKHHELTARAVRRVLF